MVTTFFDLGLLRTTTPVRRSLSFDTLYTEDVYRFSISGTRIINLHLFGIAPGDIASLRLYRDNNNNGSIDGGDSYLQLSSASGSSEGSINCQAGAGNYLAVVSRGFLGPDNYLSYNLNLSATVADTFGLSYWRVSNLLPKEVKVGNLDYDRTFTEFLGVSRRAGVLSATDVTDTYHVSIGLYEGFNAILRSFNANADLRVVRDSNNNRTVELGEVVGSSLNGGTVVDRVDNINLSGDYWVQVYNVSGDTGYSLTFDHFTTPFA